ncbi:hypothetical protein AB1I63_10030 [Streptococcus pneumoniae]
MKSLKVLLGVFLLFMLGACAAKNDNGTYAYSREKEGGTYKVIITIRGSTGSLTFEETDKNGQTESKEQGLTVDQKRKTLTAEKDNSTVDYTIVDEVLTLENTHDPTLEHAEFTKE